MLNQRFTKEGAHFDSSNITERPLEPKLRRSTTHQEPPKVQASARPQGEGDQSSSSNGVVASFDPLPNVTLSIYMVQVCALWTGAFRPRSIFFQTSSSRRDHYLCLHVIYYRSKPGA
jgi:hypothetical protein